MRNKFSHLRPLTDEEEAEIQAMIASDPDAPEATDEQLAQARPFREVFSEMAAKTELELAAHGRPKKNGVKEMVSLRLDPDILARYRAKGKGWQSRLNRDLRKAIGL